MSSQDKKINSMKLSLKNLEKEAAAANEQILKLTYDNSVLCEKLNGTKEEITYLKAAFSSESQELRKKLNSQMISNEQEINGLMESNVLENH